MRIERLELENFRGFEKLDLRFAPGINLLVGVNGSGKSSVLDAIALGVGLAGNWSDRLKEAFGVNSPVPTDIRQGSDRFIAQLGVAFSNRESTTLEFSGAEIFNAFSLSQIYLPNGSFDPPNGSIELLIAFGANRSRRSRANGIGFEVIPHFQDKITGSARARLAAFGGDIYGYGEFVRWFSEVEAIENADRLREKGPNWRDPVLSSVRRAVESLGDAWSDLRFFPRRQSLFIKKKGEDFDVGILSDGEKALIALAGEIGWRLAVGCGDPKTAEAVVLLDEVELHLHPSLQRVVLPRLQAAFPKVQFIATTHSPQVVASVPSDRVHVLRDFQVVAPSGGTYGRDSNSLLEDVFGTDSRPTETRDKLDAIARAIDAESFDEARKLVAELQSTLGAQDRELNRLESMVEYLDTGT